MGSKEFDDIVMELFSILEKNGIKNLRKEVLKQCIKKHYNELSMKIRRKRTVAPVTLLRGEILPPPPLAEAIRRALEELKIDEGTILRIWDQIVRISKGYE